MRSIRWMLMLAVLALGVAAEAQCLKCYPTPGSFRKGLCGESFDGYRDRNCSYDNQPCTIPDFADPCWWLASGKSEPADRYFTTRAPMEERSASLHRRLQQLDPAAPRCRMKTVA